MKETTLPRLAAALVVAHAVGLLSLSSEAASLPSSPLEGLWARWTGDVGEIMSIEERALFDSLDSDRQRERFVAEFWRLRGTAVDRWRRNAADAQQIRPRSETARALILRFGKPAESTFHEGCESGIRPLEVWRWSSWQIERQGGPPTEAVLVLVQSKRFDPRSLEPWRPGDVASLGFLTATDVDASTFLEEGRLARCEDGAAEERLRQGLLRAVSVDALSELAPWPEIAAGRVDQMRGMLQERGESPLSGSRLELRFEGSAGRYTILRGRVNVAVENLSALPAGPLFDRVLLAGDVYQGDRLVDSFEIVHHVVGSVSSSDIDLDFYRRLSPGPYRLRLRVTDRFGVALLREDRQVEVPKLLEAAPPPPGSATGYSRLTRSEVVVLDTFPSVEVLPVPASGAETARVTAITTGGPIEAVEFKLDGRSIALDDEAPYVVDVVLPSSSAGIEAIALDPKGAALARHSTRLEREPRPFAVRFEAQAAESGELPFQLSVPEGEALDEVRCFHGRRETRLLAGPPWRCPVGERSNPIFDFLRVKAVLVNGDSVEHVIYLGPNAPEGIEVRLVELYVSVLDGSGRPVTGLGPADFRFFDGGRERPLERAQAIDNLPLNVAILMDVSSSMGRRTRVAATSAGRFFERLLTEDDHASLLAFNHDLHRLVPFTSDAEELRHAAIGLRARGSTRLHDAIVYALSQFAGLERRRALIVLSDGADVDSDFPFDHVVAASKRAGVTVYPISLLSEVDRETPALLDRLAEESGGRAFAVRSIEELDGIYRKIEEELRSQYLLVYQPEPTDDLEFRPVRVEVARPGLEARNVHGYYP